MKKQLNEHQLQQLSRQYFDELVSNMDNLTTIRIQNVRYRALNNLSSDKQHSFQWLRAAVAAVMLIILLSWQIVHKKAGIGDDFLAVEEIIQIEENQDLLNELDFYQWLEIQRKQGKQV